MTSDGRGLRGDGNIVPLRLLLDTNIFVAAEPYSGDLEPGIGIVTALLRLAAEQGHKVFLHPATLDDIRENKDPIRERQRRAEFERYPVLEECPIPASLLASAGPSVEGSNDHRDLRILAALYARAVTYLVTDDKRLLRRAYRAGLADSVFTAREALDQLRQLEPAETLPPPSVERIKSYAVDAEQQIFDGLRADYEGFDKWLEKVRAESEFRPCFVVKKDAEYAAMALLKHEADCEYGFVDPVLKMATFKVAAEHSGAKYGELLLKAIFKYAHNKHCSTLYVEVFEKHQELILLLADFGFELSGYQTERGELVMVKRLAMAANGSNFSALEYHKTFGPPAVLANQSAWAIPIVPQWHIQLFPDAPEPVGSQLFIPGIGVANPKPWGNALKKAYLCHSKVTKMEPGDLVLFYRSKDDQAVTSVGVVEKVHRTSDPTGLLSYVGRRTVYSLWDIDRMCRSGPVLAILFRQDRFLEPAWGLSELVGNGLLTGWPQSITKIKEGGMEWLRTQLAG